MSLFALLLWIVLGVALQVAIYVGVVLWRQWLAYQALRRQAEALAITPRPAAADALAELPPLAWAGLRPFRVVRKVTEDASQAVCSFYLAPEDGRPLPLFRPGQFLTFRLDIPAADGAPEQIIRCYSLSDAPATDHYRISVKRIPAPTDQAAPPGRSSNFLHDHVEVGDVMQVRAPAGHFCVDRGDAPIVLVAGGIGVTPMLSILNWSLAEQPGREVWLFYGVRNGREMVMAAHLEALIATHPNFHLRLCFSAPLPGDLIGPGDRRRGHLDIGKLRMQLPLKPYHFYVCGPTPMMQSLVPALEEWGVPAARIHYEAFGPASIELRKVAAAETPLTGAAGELTVTFARSGKKLRWRNEYGNLLQLAEAGGISVKSGCRAGGCGACQTTIRTGEVGYRQSPDFDPEPGTCLLCMCTPKTNVTLEA